MAELSFEGLFHTTNKGLPDTSSLEPYAYLSLDYFIYSLLIQIMIGLVILAFLGLAVYRAIYKVKDKRLFPSSNLFDEREELSQDDITVKKTTKKGKEDDSEEGEQHTAENLIYRFDEEDAEKEKVEDKEVDSDIEEDEDNDKEVADDEVTEWFVELDHKSMLMAPFLITFMIACNVFAASIFALLLFLACLIVYFLFNIKGYGGGSKLLSSAFMLPCVISLFIVLLDDWNMST